MVKKISFIALSLILLQNSLFAAAALQTKSDELTADFTLLDLENKEVSLSDFKGKPVILFFWTTWCPYCRAELKQLNAMHTQFLENGAQVVAINVEESAEKVQRFIKNLSFSYKVLLDKEATVARNYGIWGVPTYVFINRGGRIVFHSHYFSQNKYKDIISK